jgi:hypothetical protein
MNQLVPHFIHPIHLSILHMSSYDPYRFLQGQQPPHSSDIEQIHIPIYAEPDLDPSGPLPRSKRDNRTSSHSHRMADQNNEAGPSRKRPRDSESDGMNGGSSNGHQEARSERPPSERPVPLSMFGFDARNDLTREIGNWLVHTCQGRENIEVRSRSYSLAIGIDV